MIGTFAAGLITGSLTTVFAMALCTVSGRASDREEAIARRDKPDILFLCNQKKQTCGGITPSCKRPEDGERCKYTSDILYAKNFEWYEGIYWEIEDGETIEELLALEGDTE